MNMNKASLDRFDASGGVYHRNIFEASNPDVVRGLGDVGNDIKVYGSKLYVVVNISNKVEVLDLKTARRIGKIDIQNCRYITFDAGKAYVSSYEAAVGNTNKAEGSIVRIDTSTLSIEARTKVGRQPEEMAIPKELLIASNLMVRCPISSKQDKVRDMLYSFTSRRGRELCPGAQLFKSCIYLYSIAARTLP